jgi:hypothetical protein
MLSVLERTGVLVIRVWAEGDRPPSLRARITRTLDLTHPDEESTAASSSEEIVTVVSAWLSEFERSLRAGA